MKVISNHVNDSLHSLNTNLSKIFTLFVFQSITNQYQRKFIFIKWWNFWIDNLIEISTILKHVNLFQLHFHSNVTYWLFHDNRIYFFNLSKNWNSEILSMKMKLWKSIENDQKKEKWNITWQFTKILSPFDFSEVETFNELSKSSNGVSNCC